MFESFIGSNLTAYNLWLYIDWAEYTLPKDPSPIFWIILNLLKKTWSIKVSFDLSELERFSDIYFILFCKLN